MFAPPVVKPQSVPPQCSAVAARRPGQAAVTQRQLLQRTISNQAMLRLLARRAGATSNATGPIQAKLKIGAVSDPLEHEADHVVDRVMRMPAPEVSVAAAPRHVSRKCADCEEEKLQRESAAPQAASSEAPASVHEVLRAPGLPLDAATRAYFEPRFGHDFSRVRVHTGAAADQSARDVNAYAYTTGHDIVFGAERFAPGTHEGRRLIAHELTHVVQQGKATSLPASATLPIDTSGEPTAEQASGKVMSGHSASGVGSGPGTIIQRQGLMPNLPPLPSPWPTSIPIPPIPPVVPVPHERLAKPDDQLKEGQCGSPDLPRTLVSFFPGPRGQGGRVKASPLTLCPGNTTGSKPKDQFYADQFKCINATPEEKGNWVRGHILHGETDRSGYRNLHGPGDTAANLIIIDQSLNQSMRSWIEDAVLKLVYGPLPHVLWLNAWVDSYHPGLEFFADSISVEYGRFDTRSGTELPRWNFKQFVLSRKPPYCPADGFAGGVFPWIATGASSSGFQSTIQVCHRQLESRVFDVAYGGLMVAIDAKWVGRGPGQEAAGAEGQPEGCPRQNYRVALYREHDLARDEWISTSDELSTGRREVQTWRRLDDGQYYLRIWTDNVDPSCCLEGDITVAPFDAPGRKSRRPPEIV